MSTTGSTPPAVRPDRVREALLRKAGLTQAQIDDVLKTERETGQPLDQVLAEIDRLTVAQVAEACRAYFAPERHTVLSLGPGRSFRRG